MHVTLLHNPKAGGGDFSREKLVHALVAAGHAVTYQSTKEKGWESVLDHPTDVVMVGGGDGTVRKAAGHLVGRHIPIALLPLGTANNISKTIGTPDSLHEAIVGLESAPRRRFDLGIAKGAWGETHFLEAVGLGAFAVTMCLADGREGNRDDRTGFEDLGLTRDLRFLRRVLSRMSPQAWQIEADGEDLSGEYFLLEAMNIRSVGPNLFLAPHADPNDGSIDLVLVSEKERKVLGEYLATRIAGGEADLQLPKRRVKAVKIHAAGEPVHVDDRLERPHEKPSAMGGLVDLSLREGALEFIVKPSDSASSGEPAPGPDAS
jgi:diacylglycerol kinase family enzyme